MSDLDRWPDGFYHPASEAELARLIRSAAELELPVRIRGAAHSEPPAIYSTPRLAGRSAGAMDIVLDRMATISLDVETKQARVQAGCHFGLDPRDPTGRSTEDNGLCPTLEAAGLALTTMGGVSHQTVAGFLATGSEGASLTHGFHEHVQAFTLIDGEGRTHRLTRDDEAFYAAGVSMGLFGVVSEVTLSCVERFDLEGEERVSDRADAELDLFSTGADGLADFLAREPYARILWWPQPGVDRLVVWKARRATGSGPARPYEAFPRVAGSRLPMQAAAGLALRAIGTRPARFARPAVRGVVEGLLAPTYRAFVPVTAPQTFRDAWHRALPLDDQMEERLMPVRFTELWVDINDAAELMSRLQNLFSTRGYAATGNFVCEIYGGKRSPFWMSPGYGRDSVRVNVFWLSTNQGAPEEGMFRSIWDVARDLGARLHWGKILDPEDRTHAQRWPRFDDFLQLRARFDPQGRLLSDYWRRQLGEEVPKVSVPACIEPAYRPIFSMHPTDRDFVAQAKGSFSASFITKASPERAFELFRVDPTDWMKDMSEYRRLTGPQVGVGAVFEEVFFFMTVRLMTVAEDPGRRWTASVHACDRPLAERMLQDITFEPHGTGTKVTWSTYYDPLPPLATVEPIVRRAFRRLFQRFCNQACAYLDAEVMK